MCVYTDTGHICMGHTQRNIYTPCMAGVVDESKLLLDWFRDSPSSLSESLPGPASGEGGINSDISPSS